MVHLSLTDGLVVWLLYFCSKQAVMPHKMGDGIPNFQNAFTHFLTTDSSDSAQTNLFKAYYNSSNKTINIQLNKSGQNSQIQLFSVTGTLIYNAPIIESQTIISTHTFAKGIYAIRIITNGETFSQKIILY